MNDKQYAQSLCKEESIATKRFQKEMYNNIIYTAYKFSNARSFLNGGWDFQTKNGMTIKMNDSIIKILSEPIMLDDIISGFVTILLLWGFLICQ